jgi:hypothetical protein
MAKPSIYVVDWPDGQKSLCRALTRAGARNHVAAQLLTVRLPTQDELIELSKTHEIADATAKAEPTPEGCEAG